MARVCDICDKGPSRGQHIARRGLARAKGGVGRKITGRSFRTFLPNIQNIRIVKDGKTIRAKVCTDCLRRRVTRAVS